LKLKPSPIVGEAMNMLLEATLEGKIKTKDEAFKMLEQWWKRKRSV
jgi:hypothetical protein